MDKFALSFHIRLITVQYTGQNSCVSSGIKKSIHLPAVLPLHTCHTQLMCTQKWPKWRAGFSGKRSSNFATRCTTAVQNSAFLWMVWRCMMIKKILEIFLDLSLLWKKLTHLTFCWVWGRRRRRPWWWRRWPGWWRRRGGRSRRQARRRNLSKARRLAPAKPFFSSTNFNFLTLKSKVSL